MAPAARLTDSEAARFARRSTLPYFHAAGTCAMGTGTDAVVGPDLRVHGIERLRVADASVMPEITSANTRAPTMMIAEMAADLVTGGDALGEPLMQGTRRARRRQPRGLVADVPGINPSGSPSGSGAAR